MPWKHRTMKWFLWNRIGNESIQKRADTTHVCSFLNTKKLTIRRGYYNIEGNYEKR